MSGEVNDKQNFNYVYPEEVEELDSYKRMKKKEEGKRWRLEYI